MIYIPFASPHKDFVVSCSVNFGALIWTLVAPISNVGCYTCALAKVLPSNGMLVIIKFFIWVIEPLRYECKYTSFPSLNLFSFCVFPFIRQNSVRLYLDIILMTYVYSVIIAYLLLMFQPFPNEEWLLIYYFSESIDIFVFLYQQDMKKVGKKK